MLSDRQIHTKYSNQSTQIWIQISLNKACLYCEIFFKMGCRTYRDNLACYFLSKKREEKLTLKKCKGKINYLDHFLFTCAMQPPNIETSNFGSWRIISSSPSLDLFNLETTKSRWQCESNIDPGLTLEREGLVMGGNIGLGGAGDVREQQEDLSWIWCWGEEQSVIDIFVARGTSFGRMETKVGSIQCCVGWVGCVGWVWSPIRLISSHSDNSEEDESVEIIWN